jgi:branched-chain amino acid transport system substrate-binding protein
VKSCIRQVSRHRGAQAAVALLGLFVLTLAGCDLVPGGTAPVVRIGLVAPFEGRHRGIGYDVIYAARLAIRQANARGGIEGYRVELVALDDGGEPELAERAARSLIIDPMVVAAMGHWLDETTAAARPIYLAAGLPLIEMDHTAAWSSEIPPGFLGDYQAVAPFAQEPGPHAAEAYVTCRTLIASIGQAIAAVGRPTRAGIATTLSQ